VSGVELREGKGSRGCGAEGGGRGGHSGVLCGCVLERGFICVCRYCCDCKGAADAEEGEE
jgi:hypothetical protein